MNDNTSSAPEAPEAPETLVDDSQPLDNHHMLEDQPVGDVPRSLAAVAGVLSAGIALGVGELLSGLSKQIPSLVARVGDIVINNVPGSIERWAISTLGENDKPALVIGITVISLLIGAATGIAASRRFRAAWTVFGMFGLIGALAAGSDPQRSVVLGWMSALISAAVGLAALYLLLRSARSTFLDMSASPDAEEQAGLQRAPSRRTFVSTATAAAAVILHPI